MIYFQTTTMTKYKYTDAKRFTLTGYPGGIYKAVDNADYGGGVEHCTEWVEKYSYTIKTCLLYTSPSPRDGLLSRMPSSA